MIGWGSDISIATAQGATLNLRSTGSTGLAGSTGSGDLAWPPGQLGPPRPPPPPPRRRRRRRLLDYYHHHWVNWGQLGPEI